MNLQEAKEEIEKWKQIAYTDPLTQIGNRRRADDAISSAGIRVFMILDVDHFKQFNDTKGHSEGDRVLIEVAAAIASCLRRKGDIVARYGGEEFIVITKSLPSNSLKLAQELRAAVEAIGVTVSIGVTQQLKGECGKEAINRADKALYMAKNSGRNCVCAIFR